VDIIPREVSVNKLYIETNLRVDIIPREVSVNKLYIETNLFQIGGHFRR